MFKLVIYGFLNSSTKLRKKNAHHTGYLNIQMFVFFLKSALLVSDTKLKYGVTKKNSKNLIFMKSDFKYKISKHSTTKVSNSFFIEILAQSKFCFLESSSFFRNYIVFIAVSTNYLNISKVVLSGYSSLYKSV